MRQIDMFAEAATAARDAALERVASGSPDWITNALNLIRLMPYGEYTGEDVRLWLTPQIGEPHHHNATGAFIRMAIKRNLLRKTGRYTQMRTKKSHARITPVYRAGT